MTDVWKSNARRFCEICKVWFADNRVSIEHHEAGQKHKAAIQAKLRELARQNKEKEKAKASLEATLAMMETAALSSMKSGTGESQVPSCGSFGPAPKHKTYFDPKAHKESLSELAQEIARRRKEYINTQLNKSSKDTPKTVANDTTEHESSETPVWVQALSNEGIPYYFHMYSGETTWEAPAQFLTAEQYACKYQKIKEQLSEVSPSTSGVEQTEGTDKASKKSPQAEKNQKESASKEDIKPEISEETRIAMAANFHIGDAEIPLPPSGDQSSSSAPVVPMAPVKQEVKTEVDVGQDNDGGISSNSNAERETVTANTTENADVEQKSLQSLVKPSMASESEEISHPYGAWKRVEKSPEPPKIDYGLPSEAEGRRKKQDVEIRPEDVVVFTEKTAPISRKKKNLDAPIQFKKRKTNLSIRKQGNIP